MATCDMGYEHDGPVPAEDPAPEPVVVESGPNENDVKIAEIEATVSLERERIWTEQQELALAAENESLRGEIRGIREVLDRLAPPEPESATEPAVVPVQVNDDARAEDGPPPPAETTAPAAPKEKKSKGWWG